MDILNTYQNILSTIKDNKRPNLQYSKEDFLILFEGLGHAFTEVDEEKIIHILCILDHCASKTEIFEGLLCKILKSDQFSTKIKIYTLSTTQKFIIQRRNQHGEPLPSYYLEAVTALLKTKDAELFEWSLRSIDEMGPQGRPLVHEILKHRPKGFKLFNKHWRNSHELIEMLLEKWNLK